MANKKSTRLWRNSNNVRTTQHVQNFSIAEDSMRSSNWAQELELDESGRVLLINTDTSMKDLLIRLKGLVQANYPNSECSGKPRY